MKRAATGVKPERSRSAQIVDQALAAEISRAFKALADPTRVRLVAALERRELCVHDLCVELGLEQSTVSHQLRILRDQELVRHRRDGRHIYYSLDDGHVQALFAMALDHVSHTRTRSKRQ